MNITDKAVVLLVSWREPWSPERRTYKEVCSLAQQRPLERHDLRSLPAPNSRWLSKVQRMGGRGLGESKNGSQTAVATPGAG